MAPIPVESLEVVKGSELPEVTNPSGMTFLGYETTSVPSDTVRISFENMTSLFGITQNLTDSDKEVISNAALKIELDKAANTNNTVIRSLYNYDIITDSMLSLILINLRF